MSNELLIVTMVLIGLPIVLWLKQRLGHFEEKKS